MDGADVNLMALERQRPSHGDSAYQGQGRKYDVAHDFPLDSSIADIDLRAREARRMTQMDYARN